MAKAYSKYEKNNVAGAVKAEKIKFDLFSQIRFFKPLS